MKLFHSISVSFFSTIKVRKSEETFLIVRAVKTIIIRIQTVNFKYFGNIIIEIIGRCTSYDARKLRRS